MRNFIGYSEINFYVLYIQLFNKNPNGSVKNMMEIGETHAVVGNGNVLCDNALYAFSDLFVAGHAAAALYRHGIAG